MSYLALDIGGTNLKVADGNGFAGSYRFPLWQESSKLSEAIRMFLASAPKADHLSVTMTGELADCFATKAEGVNFILDAVEQSSNSRQTSVYLCDGRLVSIPIARREPLLAAASNWHALATFACRFINDALGLLIDVGSTTTDIIPLGPERPLVMGRTDPERLALGELVYTGVERSPICAIVQELPWHGETCTVAQELFATTLDAYLLLDELQEDERNQQTADGRARTKDHAHARLARMICADTTMFSREDANRAAKFISKSQLQSLAPAAKRVIGKMEVLPTTIVLSGQGEFLALSLIEQIGHDGNVVSLHQKLGAEVSRCACAHALAVLASERARA